MSRILCVLIITAFSSVSWIFAEEASDEQEKNKETVQQWIKEVWQEHNSSFINEITTKDFDRAGAIAFADTTFADYPDFSVEIMELVAEDDNVAVRWKAKGTSADDLTKGKEISFSGMSFVRFEGGKIAESPGYWNQLTILTQLGYTVTPPSAEPSEKEEDEDDDDDKDDED